MRAAFASVVLLVATACGVTPHGVSVAANACKTGTVSCAGVCVDLTGDAKNCGACGHDCKGGECSAHACQPIVLASDPAHPTEIAVDADHVYWSDPENGVYGTPSALFAMPLDGDTPKMLAKGKGAAGQIVLAGTSVYWANGDIVKLPRDGGAPVVLVHYAGDAFAVDAANVYWPIFTTVGEGGTYSSVLETPIAGGKTITVAVAKAAVAVAVDARNVYWTDSGARAVMSIAVETSAPANMYAIQPRTIAVDQNGPSDIAIDSTNVYWTTDDGNIMKAPVEGGTPTTLALGQPRPSHIAIDGASVYWTNDGAMQGHGSVMNVPIAGGPTRTLAANQDTPSGIAVDAQFVYWTNAGWASPDNGAVMKIVKP